MSFAARVLVALTVAAGALALWQLRQLLLLVFGAVLLAVVLASAGQALHRWTRLSYRAGVALTVALTIVVLTVGIWFAGGVLAAQLGELVQRLPAAERAGRSWLGSTTLGSYLLGLWDDAALQLSWRRVAGAAGFTLGLLGNTLLVVATGIFLALDPALYRGGALRLVPPSQRAQLGAALDACGEALAGWLKGQAVAMLFVGFATWGGLALLGIPLAGILGVIAGVLDFIPFVGPIVSGLLAVLVSLQEGPRAALYVAGLALAIQQVEGNVAVPLLQRRAAHLPPAITVLAVVAVTVLFGLTGILFATPLAVVTLVLVRRLYVEGWLESDPLQPPG